MKTIIPTKRNFAPYECEMTISKLPKKFDYKSTILSRLLARERYVLARKWADKFQSKLK